MKKSISHLILSLICVTSIFQTTLTQDCASGQIGGVTPTIVTRSQGSDNSRKLVGLTNHTHLYDMGCWWGTFSIMLEYTHSFNATNITQNLFGTDLINNGATSCGTNCNDARTIIIQGSCVENRDSHAWLADYLYLPTDFDGSISFDPHICNVNIPLDFYLGLNAWACDLYLRLYGSITYTRWDLEMCESVKTAGTNPYPAGYFSREEIANNNLIKRPEVFFTGNRIVATDNVDSDIKFNELNFARLQNFVETNTAFADFHVEFGWDFLNTCDYHLGAAALIVAPTGSKRLAANAFNPIVGNGNHWQLGGVITGHYTMWQSCDEDKYFGFHFDANITHLFTATEQRTFDLCGKPNSRYMLAERLSPVITNRLAGIADGVVPAIELPEDDIVRAEKQIIGEYAPVANLTTFDVDVKTGVHADIAAEFNLTSCNWSWDIGYNFWARSCEEIEIDNCISECLPIQTQCWALKGNGRAFAYTVDNTPNDGLDPDTPVALSATQSNATIHNGTNPETGGPLGSPCLTNNNTGIDNPQLAYASGNNTTWGALSRITGESDLDNQINTSIQPILLSKDDIDIKPTRGMSHKIYTHLNYEWHFNCYEPFFGAGGYVEFAKNDSNPCPAIPDSTNTCFTPSCKNSCVDCAVSQWAIWIKGGIQWN